MTGATEDSEASHEADRYLYKNQFKKDFPYDPKNFAVDPLENEFRPGVLLADAIMRYAEVLSPHLIDPFETKRLRAASYELTLGDEYYRRGKYERLNKDNPDLTIPAYGIVIVESAEELHIPRYMIGRWNLRLSYVYSGLLWSGAAQVDPGYHGKLSCPLYNLSNRPVTLKYKEHVFTIDFEKTTKYTQSAEEYRFNKSGEEEGQNLSTPRASSLRDLAHLHQYWGYELVSGVEKLQEDSQKNEADIRTVEKTLDTNTVDLQKRIRDFAEDLQKKINEFATMMFLALSIVITALAITGFAPVLAKQTVPPRSLDLLMLIAFAALALFLSVFSFIYAYGARKGQVQSE